MTLNEELDAHVAALTATVSTAAPLVVQIADTLCAAFAAGGRLLLCGNGGSAADAQHVAAEFVNHLRADRDPLPAIALTTDTSVLTCVANDSCYDEVFARQVKAFARHGDVLLALSTSGRSANVHAALVAARAAGALTVGLTGATGKAPLSGLCDILVAVPSDDCARIQECHEFLLHAIAGMVEVALFEGGDHTCGAPELERA